ncbi:MAG: histidine--tRNA ligase [Planctomycetota bacterium]|nr:MAG: histidine--tRNA ligase [Planctomycetota bacterium]
MRAHHQAVKELKQGFGHFNELPITPMKFQSPKGTRDFYPAEMAVRRRIEAAWRDASIAFGYDEIDGPTFEHLELYTAKSGEGIINELFSFRRAGGSDDYALRPEFTPTLARMAAARAAQLPMPVKWFAVPNFFRAERPQRGRLREFYQWNVDLLGAEGPAIDAEVIGVAVAALARLGLRATDVRVKISHRVAAANVVRALGVADESVAGAFELLDRRDKMPPEEFTKRAAALGLAGDGLARFEAVVRTRVQITDDIGVLATTAGIAPESLAELVLLRDALVAAGLAEWCEFDLGIVRGLAYYTGTVFEIHEASGGERAIAGGGRYDGLIELFGGPKTPAIGFGMGDVVLGLVLADRGLLPADGTELLPRPDAFIIALADPAADAELPRLVARLRSDGLHIRHSYKATRNVGKLLADASKQRARFAVLLGAELADGRVMLKDLASGEQQPVALTELPALLRAPA